jgi:hypothetical protein
MKCGLEITMALQYLTGADADAGGAVIRETKDEPCKAINQSINQSINKEV